MLRKGRLRVLPHGIGQDVAGVRFNVARELLGGIALRIDGGNPFDAKSHFLDWRTTIRFAEIQMQRPRRNQSSDIRRITMRMDPRNEVGKAMQEFGPVNRFVCR